jgi:hypothetical protein
VSHCTGFRRSFQRTDMAPLCVETQLAGRFLELRLAVGYMICPKNPQWAVSRSRMETEVVGDIGDIVRT